MVGAMTEDPSLGFAGARVDLTPPAGTELAGYGARGAAVATGVHDPLEAVILSLVDRRTDGQRVTWVVIDAVAVDAELAATVADRVGAALASPPESVIVAATHTHSGPSGWVERVHPAFPARPDGAMRAEVVARIGAAAAAVAGSERPVTALVADGPAPGVGTDRTDPDRPRDDSAGILALVDGDGAIAGLLVDHACHATVLGADNLSWSADWPGAARRALGGALSGSRPFQPSGHPREQGGSAPASPPAPPAPPAPPPIVAVAQGAAGDVSPRFVRRGQTFAEVDRIGGLLAASALRALLSATPAGDGAPRLLVRRTTIAVPTRPIPAVAEARRLADDAAAALRTASAEPGPRERIARTRWEGAELLSGLAERGIPSAFQLPVTVVALGDAAWVHLPVELFTSFGQAIRAGSPFGRTRVIGYAGGYFGYVADRAAHAAGIYEASASVFDATAGDVLVEASLALLRRVHAGMDVAAGMAGVDGGRVR